ncbi:MAG TPA: hypothetical protein VFM55_24940 [Micromonosporaceae bacterium]|nr:hypothetical protein [Micromonosporaceae bacterium]
MSKERARRRADRLAAAQRQRAAREAAAARRQRRRALLRRLTPRRPDRRTGRLFARRTRAERAGIAVAGGGVLFLVWTLVDSMALRVGLTALVLVAAPALVVLTLDRRV